MRNKLIFGFALLVFGISIYLWSLPSVGLFNTATMNDGTHSKHSHSHENLEPVPASKPYPELSVVLRRQNGENILLLRTKNFVFEAEESTDTNGMKGHAHLLVDGESIAMFYTDRYVLPDFMKGTYTLKVTLNQVGTHAPISVNGSIVSDTVELTVQERQQ
jgi:hypothetical protein